MTINTIQDHAAVTYGNNITYFEQNHSDLFHKLTSLDFVIDAKHYEEKYALEYMDEGYFDVKELSTELFLYGEDSLEYAQRVMPKNDEMKESPKVIFFGTGLGTHISLINGDIDTPASYLIIEDNIELFRLSLFVVDYAKLAKSASLNFSVMQNDETFKATFTTFYQKEEQFNDYIQYFIFSSRYMQKSEDVKTFIASLKA